MSNKTITTSFKFISPIIQHIEHTNEIDKEILKAIQDNSIYNNIFSLYLTTQSIIGRRTGKYNEGKGWKSDIQSLDIDFNKPIILCLGGTGTDSESDANGIAKIVQLLLGLDGINNDKIQNFSAYYKDEKDIKTIVDSIYQIIIKPIIDQDGLLRYLETCDASLYNTHIEIIRRQLRNITIFSHCFGTQIAKELSKKLETDLISHDFKKDEIKDLLSEIVIFMLSPRNETLESHSLNLAFTNAFDRNKGMSFSEYKNHEDICKDVSSFINKFMNNEISGTENFCIKRNNNFYHFWDTDTFGADLSFNQPKIDDDFDDRGNSPATTIKEELFYLNIFHTIEQYCKTFNNGSKLIHKNDKAQNLRMIMTRALQNAVSLSLKSEKRTIHNLISNKTPITYTQAKTPYSNIEFSADLDKLIANYEKIKENKTNNKIFTPTDLLQNHR